MSEEQRRQGVGGSEVKNLVNLSRQYKYKVKEMMMRGSRLVCQTRKKCFMADSSLLKGQPKPLMVRMLEECHNITSSLK